MDYTFKSGRAHIGGAEYVTNFKPKDSSQKVGVTVMPVILAGTGKASLVAGLYYRCWGSKPRLKLNC